MMSSRVLILILCVLLVYAWARSRLAHMCSWRLHVSGRCCAPNTAYGLPCNMCMVIVGIWVTTVLTMPLHLAHSDSLLVTTLPLVGFIITLMLLRVLMAVTTSARSRNDCNTFEEMQRHFLNIGVSVVFIIGFTVPFVHFAWLMVVCVFCSTFPIWVLASSIT